MWVYMNGLTKTLTFLFLFNLFLINATEVSKNQAILAVKGWLKSADGSFGQTRSNSVTGAEEYKDSAGNNIFYKVDLGSKGFVITSADDEYEPIISFSNESSGTIQANSPLYAMLSTDPRCKAPSVKTLTTRSKSPSQTKWTDLIAQGSTTFKTRGIASVSDVRVAPLLQTKWDQSEVQGQPFYNKYTPNQYLCGCVATAMAQLMYYHKHPSTGIGTIEFAYTVDGDIEIGSTLGGDGDGGAYQWNLMPQIPKTANLTTVKVDAVARLCYDAGISVSMMYSENWSGAYMSDAATALQNVFKFSNVQILSNYGDGIEERVINQLICSNLDAKLPVILGIKSDSAGGHAIVCDGYGYDGSSVLYHHLNMGWGGSKDVWYNLPLVDDGYYNFTKTTSILGNIYKSGSGGIISGRVLDDNGQPVSGVIVTYSGGSTTTDSKGIYAFSRVGSGTHTISAGKSRIRLSLPEGGNIWNANLAVSGLPDLLPYKPSGWTDEIVLSTNTGTNTDSPVYQDSKVYADFAIFNDGVATTTGVNIKLYLDDKQLISFMGPLLAYESYTSWQDVNFYQLENLSYGSHQLKLVIDQANELMEYDENNNEYIKQFYVRPRSEHGEIVSVGDQSFTGGISQEVTVQFRSYHLDSGGDCIIECDSLPDGWSINTKRYNLDISDDGTVFSQTFVITAPVSGGNGNIVWKLYDDGTGVHPAGSTLLDSYTQAVSARDTVPSVSTVKVFEPTETSVYVSAEILDLKGYDYSQSGIEISQSSTDWVGAKKFYASEFSNEFMIDCVGLERYADYYCRAFCSVNVRNELRTGYGEVKGFRTKFIFATDLFLTIEGLEGELVEAGITDVLDENLELYQNELLSVKDYIGSDTAFVQSVINKINEDIDYKVITFEPGWNLISPPFDDFDISDFIGLHPEVCSVFAYENQSYRLCQKADDGSMILKTGEAYWVFSLERCGVVVRNDGAGEYNPTLLKGWNLIGPPASISFHNFSALFDEYIISCWGWNSMESLYERVNFMELGKGYWIQASEDTELIP